MPFEKLFNHYFAHLAIMKNSCFKPNEIYYNHYQFPNEKLFDFIKNKTINLLNMRNFKSL